MSARVGQLLTDAAAMLFPSICVVCGEIVTQPSERLCASCADKAREERSRTACGQCGRTIPVGGTADAPPVRGNADGGAALPDPGAAESPVGRASPAAGAGATCLACAHSPGVLGGMTRVAEDGGVVGTMLRAMKFRGRDEMGALLRGWLAQCTSEAPWVEEVDAVVSVPTHWRLRLRRPLHLPEVLAPAVARAIGRPVAPLLRRTRVGRHQVGLTFSERQQNVVGLFAVPRGVRVAGARILVVDDVRTTGATLEACARALLRAGAKETYGAVLVKVAWTDRPTGAPIDV
jgi:predicted amidophosphoribosyltransferase